MVWKAFSSFEQAGPTPSCENIVGRGVALLPCAVEVRLSFCFISLPRIGLAHLVLRHFGVRHKYVTRVNMGMVLFNLIIVVLRRRRCICFNPDLSSFMEVMVELLWLSLLSTDVYCNK